MAYGDAQYQINALEKRLDRLETQGRGSTTKGVANTPQVVATSVGSGVVGSGLGQDAVSRAAITAVVAGLASIESLQDVNVAPKTVNFGGGVTQTVYQTNYLRPDPIIGDTYRTHAAGFFSNSTGGNGTITLGWALNASVAPIGTISITFGTGLFVAWWLLVLATVTAGGPSGTYLLNQRWSFTGANVGVGGAVTNDSLATASVGPTSLVAPAPTISATASLASASLSVTVNQYSLERVGSGFASKA